MFLLPFRAKQRPWSHKFPVFFTTLAAQTAHRIYPHALFLSLFHQLAPEVAVATLLPVAGEAATLIGPVELHAVVGVS